MKCCIHQAFEMYNTDFELTKEIHPMYVGSILEKKNKLCYIGTHCIL